MPRNEQEGRFIGDIYILRRRNTTELIPCQHISYVSARYSSKPLYLILGVLAIMIGLLCLGEPSFGIALGLALGLNPETTAWGLIVLGIVLALLFLGSRRVGVELASSGGKLFVETRGRGRLELLNRIQADLVGLRTLAEDEIIPRLS